MLEDLRKDEDRKSCEFETGDGLILDYKKKRKCFMLLTNRELSDRWGRSLTSCPGQNSVIYWKARFRKKGLTNIINKL